MQPNAPSVLLNDVMLYDFLEDKILFGQPLSREAVSCLKHIMEKFPGCGVCLYAQRNVYVISDNKWLMDHLESEHLPYLKRKLDEIEEDWYKVLLIEDEDRKNQIERYVQSMGCRELRFVSSSEHYLEMLPIGVDKSLGLNRLLEQSGIPRENVCAIGDYYNDLELLKAAGFAVVPDNAPDDVKQVADLVVGRCDTGAVADLIEYLEKNAE